MILYAEILQSIYWKWGKGDRKSIFIKKEEEVIRIFDDWDNHMPYLLTNEEDMWIGLL